MMCDHTVGRVKWLRQRSIRPRLGG
jgi:hypothetical protein